MKRRRSPAGGLSEGPSSGSPSGPFLRIRMLFTWLSNPLPNPSNR